MNPITRKEMFLAAAGGQDVETPTPVTREEVFLDEIAKGGGGSSLPSTETASAGDVLSLDDNKEPQWATPSGGGGGVLVVRGTYDEDTEKTTLDKTWNEIHTAAATMPVVIVLGSGDTIDQYPLYRVEYYDGEYSVSVRGEGANAADSGYYMNDWIFGCAGENDYPVYPYIPK